MPSSIVLSKLKHFARDNASNLTLLRSRVDVRPALEKIGARHAPFVPVSGGTLGVGFIATVDGRQQFFKSYASAHSTHNLEKEIRIMSHLYGELLGIRRIEVHEGDGPPRIWLVMDALEPPITPLTPSDTLTLIKAYRSRLKSFAVDSPKTTETLGILVDEAIRGLSRLASMGQIGDSMRIKLHTLLTHLADEWQTLPPAIAHGDLGPRNIMTADGELVVIDWEDAFVGVEGYDYLYWLTFFENRRYYGSDILGHTPLGLKGEVALLAMILILKSDLSVRANTHVGNQLTFEQRIVEVLAFA